MITELVYSSVGVKQERSKAASVSTSVCLASIQVSIISALFKPIHSVLKRSGVSNIYRANFSIYRANVNTTHQTSLIQLGTKCAPTRKMTGRQSQQTEHRVQIFVISKWEKDQFDLG